MIPSWWQRGHTLALGLVAACLALAFLSGECLEQTRLLIASAPCAFSSQVLGDSIRQSGAAADDTEGGVRLYENASVGFDLRTPESTILPLFLVARGTPALGLYPLVSLHADRRFVNGAFVTSDNWGLFRILVPLSAGKHRIDLAYINDEFFYPADRNLDIRSVSLGKPPPDADAYYRWRAPCHLAPARLSVQTFAEREGSGVAIRNHGRLGDDVYFDRAGWYSLRIPMAQPRRVARSSRLRVELEGSPATHVVLGSATDATYVAQVRAEAGLARLTLANESSFWRRPPEADIRIAAISIGEPVLPAAPLPRTLDLSAGPARSSGASLDHHSGGNAVDGDAWVLWSNGFMSQGLRCNDAGTWRIGVTARGDLCKGDGPRMLVMVDRDQVASFRVVTTEFRDYSASVTLSGGPHELFLVFDNDLKMTGEGDRNLYVQSVTVSAVEPGMRSK